MAIKSERRIAKKEKLTVKKHTQTQETAKIQETPQQNQQALQTPVVASGFPQPIQPQPQPLAPQLPNPPSPAPSPVNNQTQPSVDNLTPQLQSLDAKLSSVPQQSAQPAVETSAPSQEFTPEKKSKLWLFVIVGAMVALMAGGVLFYFRSKAVKQAVEEKVLPTPTLAPVTPTVSPATESANLKVDYSKYEIRVLNGSGVKGEASKVKDSLEEEKFVVKDIDNAESSDYEKTVIKAKKDVPKEYLDKLKQMLGKTYVLDTEEELKESASVDVIVIIGSSKKP